MAAGKKTAKKGKAAKPASAKAKKPTSKVKKTPPKAAKANKAKPTKSAKPAAKKAPPKKSAPKKAPPKKAPPKKAAPPKAAKKIAPPTAAKKAPPPKAAKKAAPPKAAKPAAPAKAAKAAPAPKPAPAPKAPAPKAAPTPPPAPQPPAAAPAKAAAKAPAAKASKEKTPKKKPIATTSLTATPVIRPLGDEAPPAAPPPPPAKPGHVDHQVLSAISYGLFAAVNKTFGFAGQSVVKNAALRMLEYGYKRGWLPPKSREPVRAVNEFFGRLEIMGYAEKIHVAKRGDNYALEVVGLADFDAVHSLREMHYPLLPVFLGEMLTAIIDQYFGMKVTTEPMEMQDQKRGFTLAFSLHERPTAPDVSRLVQYSRVDEFEE